MQGERAGGMLVAVANASDESISKPKDCILATDEVQEILNRLDVDDTLNMEKQGAQSQDIPVPFLAFFKGVQRE